MTFADTFKNVRLKQGRSITEIAKALDVPTTNISRYEKGTEPSASMILKLCNVLNVTPNELLGVMKTENKYDIYGDMCDTIDIDDSESPDYVVIDSIFWHKIAIPTKVFDDMLLECMRLNRRLFATLLADEIAKYTEQIAEERRQERRHMPTG